MKKVYQKPAMVMESYALTQSIASGCSAFESGIGEPAINASTPEACGWNDPNMGVYFTEGVVSICEWDGSELDLCYNGPVGPLMFGS